MVYSTSISLKTSSIIMGHSSCHFLWRSLGSRTRAASSLICCASALSRVGGEWCKPSAWGSHFGNPLGLGANAVVSPRSRGTGVGQWAGKHTTQWQMDRVTVSPLARLAQAPSPFCWDPNLPLGQCGGQCPQQALLPLEHLPVAGVGLSTCMPTPV